MRHISSPQRRGTQHSNKPGYKVRRSRRNAVCPAALAGVTNTEPVDAASLAASILLRSAVSLPLPDISAAAAFFTRSRGDDTVARIIEDFALLGIGSLDLWARHEKTPASYLQELLQQWIASLGADKFVDHVGLSLSLAPKPEGWGEAPAGRQPLYFMIESNQSGYCSLLAPIEALEAQTAGLGAAFYWLLTRTLNSWMNVYCFLNAEYAIEQWKEMVESDMEADDSSPSQTFEEYCEATGIAFPDLAEDVPAFLSESPFRSSDYSLSKLASLLEANRSGPFGALIKPVLQMASVRSRHPRTASDLEELSGAWNDMPLPSWLLVMHKHDAIEQMFDEDSQHMGEASAEPHLICRYMPGDPASLRAALRTIAQYVTVQANMIELTARLCAWKESTDASISRS